MESYIFCTFINLACLATIAWLGYLVEKGANMFIILAMIIITLVMVIPAKEIFTCPKCGWIGDVKTFTSGMLISRPVVRHDTESKTN